MVLYAVAPPALTSENAGFQGKRGSPLGDIVQELRFLQSERIETGVTQQLRSAQRRIARPGLDGAEAGSAGLFLSSQPLESVLAVIVRGCG